MTKYLLAGVLMAVTAPLSASAGTVENACMRSDRPGANRTLCNCIQQVADMTLGGGDQQRAASLFQNPDAAQKVRVSKRDADNAFWARYKNFGDMAGVYCAN